ncbi:MAG: 6-phosphogluconolactonase [Desulfarculaceae bacterium]|nr:6-phosphogluconolactonase [Desulfarculaceae bacterium]MCF8118243.1 6-phosphogluconolactonase [Desulfarculaceae bacterium]
MRFEVFDDAEALSRASAEFITRASHKAVAEWGRFTLVFSGGTSLLEAYGLIGAICILFNAGPIRRKTS